MNYSNPRMAVEINNWPFGRQKTTANFSVEKCPRTGRERAVRVTVNPKTGKPCTPKKQTYAKRVRFVDGSDGRLYVLEDNTDYGHLTVMEGNLDFHSETIYGGRANGSYGSKDPRFDEMFALFEEKELG